MLGPDESNYVGYNAFPPSRFYRQVRSNKFPPYFPAQPSPGRKDSTGAGAGAGFAAAKPKVITVVQAGGKSPRKLIKVLLNRRSVQPFEQLIIDVSEQFVQPAAAPAAAPGESKMFTVHGREVQGISDFFRDEDVFIWVAPDRLAGHLYGPGLAEVRELLLDLFWDKEWRIPTLMKEWERRTRRAERQRRKQQQEQLSQAQHPPQAKRTSLVPSQKGAMPFGELRVVIPPERPNLLSFVSLTNNSSITRTSDSPPHQLLEIMLVLLKLDTDAEIPCTIE